MQDTLLLTTRALRDPDALINGAESPADLARLAPPLLGVTLVGGALFGLMVGSQHGGIQLLYASLKMPLLLLAPPLIALPVVHALWRACGVDPGWRRLSIAALAGMARSAIFAAAMGPVLWLLYSIDLDYHASVLVMTGTLALAGLPGIAALMRALPRGGDLRILATLGSAAALFLAFSQTGWLLRPFIARPTAAVTLFRPIEEDVFSSLGATNRSAVGDYRGWDAERSGFLAPAPEEAP